MNEDLVGREVEIGGETWTVDSVAGWSPQYLYLVQPSDVPARKNMILRPAGIIRAAIPAQQ